MRFAIPALSLTLGLVACGDADPVATRTRPDAEGSDAHVILEGTVRRFTTYQLLGGVTVSAGQESVTSSGRGGYAFSSLREGEVQIRATYPGFLPYAAKQRLQPGRNRHDIDLVPERQR
jgi:hypothetical protein